jgi:hypothetical protein
MAKTRQPSWAWPDVTVLYQLRSNDEAKQAGGRAKPPAKGGGKEDEASRQMSTKHSSAAAIGYNQAW